MVHEVWSFKTQECSVTGCGMCKRRDTMPPTQSESVKKDVVCEYNYIVSNLWTKETSGQKNSPKQSNNI